jgi:DNA-binding PadR family transcriptional regulator
MTARTAINPRELMTPAVLHILLSLAQGVRHGFGIKEDVEARTGGALRLGPGTLYEGMHRLRRAGWIAEAGAPAGEDPRRKFYRVTAEGRRQMEAELARLEEIVRFARSRDLLPRGSRP